MEFITQSVSTVYGGKEPRVESMVRISVDGHFDMQSYPILGEEGVGEPLHVLFCSGSLLNGL